VIKIYTAANLQDAHILLGLMSAQNIQARILNASAQGGLGEIPFTHAYPEIWLTDDRDVNEARLLIAAFDRPATADNDARCERCGEDSPSGFALCWNCGATLDP